MPYLPSRLVQLKQGGPISVEGDLARPAPSVIEGCLRTWPRTFDGRVSCADGSSGLERVDQRLGLDDVVLDRAVRPSSVPAYRVHAVSGENRFQSSMLGHRSPRDVYVRRVHHHRVMRDELVDVDDSF